MKYLDEKIMMRDTKQFGMMYYLEGHESEFMGPSLESAIDYANEINGYPPEIQKTAKELRKETFGDVLGPDYDGSPLGEGTRADIIDTTARNSTSTGDS